MRRRGTSGDSARPPVQISSESIDDTSCSLHVITKYLIIFVLGAYISIPAILWLFPQIVEQIVFLNLYVGSVERSTLDRPTDAWNLPGVANFHVDYDDVELGVWHMLPSGIVSVYGQNNLATSEEIAVQLKQAENIVIYHHGNGMTRATGSNGQRPALYKLLASEGYHVIAFDYRGFGDSSGWPSEPGLVNDSIAIYSWVKRRAKHDARIIFWGHSLGSSVSTLAAKRISEQCESGQIDTICPGPDGLILEGAFTNVRQGASDSDIIGLFSYLYPRVLLEWMIETGLVQNNIFLASDENLGEVPCPVLLLHADDDNIIPARHSEELYHTCKKSASREKMRVKFIKFKADHGYGHMDIYKAPELPKIIKQFLDNEQISQFENAEL